MASNKWGVYRAEIRRTIVGPDAALMAQMALSNAKDLLEDARLLFENGRYSRAAALSIIAIEEIAKWFLVQDGFIRTSDHKWKEFWSEVRSHRTKIKKYKHSRSMEALKSLYRNPNEWTEAVAEIESEDDLQVIKEGCLYVDCDGRAVISPSQLTTNEQRASRRSIFLAQSISLCRRWSIGQRIWRR